MEKVTKLTLKENEREYLESIIKSTTSQVQTVQKAWILLLHANSVTINTIANKVGLTRKSVIQCLKKYKNSGLNKALGESPGRGRSSDFSDEEKAWIVNIVNQRPLNLGYPAEIWTYKRLKEYINENAEEAGYRRLSTISCSSLVNILKQAGIQPRKIKYPEHMHREYSGISNFY